MCRIFPFNRGLFEDKVANFWCASDVVFKWRHWGSKSALIKLSASLTALGFLPGVYVLIRTGTKLRTVEKCTQMNTRLAHTPTLPLLPYALLTASMSFFLFSFQVHEKTILLPLLPMNLLLSGSSPDSTLFAWGVLANNVAVFRFVNTFGILFFQGLIFFDHSMWPLLKRDGLAMQYVATMMLWNRLIGYNPFRLRDKPFVRMFSLVTSIFIFICAFTNTRFAYSQAVYAAGLSLHLLEFMFNPPARYPDIFPVLNVLLCTPVFALVWLWSIKCSVEVSWALGGPGPVSRSPTMAKPSSTNGEPEKHALLEGSSTSVGITRREGVRAFSLGYKHGRQRVPFGSSSMNVDSQQ
jgi:alpha-1,3-glucosyltransferase